MKKIKVTIWNEFVHEQDDSPIGDYIRTFYPDGIHRFLKEKLSADDLEIRTVPSWAVRPSVSFSPS